MWKLRLPQRVKTMLWLLHGKLLTNAERCKRGIASDPHCKYCLGHVEDLDHLFRTCPKVTPLWWHLMEPCKGNIQRSLPFDQWIKENLKEKYFTHYEEDWQTTFAVSIWWGWKWRNEAVFRNIERDSSSKLAMIRSYNQQIQSAFSNGNIVEKRKATSSIVWVKFRSRNGVR